MVLVTYLVDDEACVSQCPVDPASRHMLASVSKISHVCFGVTLIKM
jgi:hypothetical protein